MPRYIGTLAGGAEFDKSLSSSLQFQTHLSSSNESHQLALVPVAPDHQRHVVGFPRPDRRERRALERPLVNMRHPLKLAQADRLLYDLEDVFAEIEGELS